MNSTYHTIGRIDVKMVEEFAAALEDALLDVAVERSKRIVFVYDADVIVSTILGATTQVDSAPPLDVRDPKVAVRSLLGSGAFGPLRMLRPHLLEFDRVIRSIPRPQGPFPRGYLDSQRERLKRVWGFNELESLLKELNRRYDASSASGANDDVIGQEFFKFLDVHGFQTFVVAELCLGGTWFNRLRNLLKNGLLSFEKLAPFDGLDLRGQRVKEFLDTLNRERPSTHAATSNIVDAAALETLSRLSDSGTSLGVEFRFYTETDAVRQTLMHHRTDSKIAPQIGEQSVRAHGSLMRSELYFLVRASFPRLRPASSASDQLVNAAESALGPFDLDLLARELRRALEDHSTNDDIDRALSNYSILGTPLNRVLEDFFRMTFVWTYIRTQGSTKSSLHNLLPELIGALQNRDLVNQTDSSVESTLRGLHAEIGRQVGALARWKAVLSDVRRAVSRQKHLHEQAQTYRADNPFPDAEFDLGLVRWDLHRIASQNQRLMSTIEALLTSDRDELFHCAELASKYVEPNLSRDDTEFLLLVLWWLRDWRLLLDHWAARIDDYSRLGVDFRVLKLIAKARVLFESADNPSNVQSIVTDVVALFAEAKIHLIANQAKEQIGYMQMCVAHVGYWCWQVLNKLFQRVSGIVEELDTNLLHLRKSQIAEASFKAGKLAYVQLPLDSPARIFAINHCAYLGTISAMFQDETETFMQMLTQDTTNHRNFRIADTLAKPFSMHAERIISKYGLQQVRDSAFLRKEVVDNLGLAYNYLQEGRPFFGDDEASKHLASVRRRLNEFSEVA